MCDCEFLIFLDDSLVALLRWEGLIICKRALRSIFGVLTIHIHLELLFSQLVQTFECDGLLRLFSFRAKVLVELLIGYDVKRRGIVDGAQHNARREVLGVDTVLELHRQDCFGCGRQISFGLLK